MLASRRFLGRMSAIAPVGRVDLQFSRSSLLGADVAQRSLASQANAAAGASAENDKSSAHARKPLIKFLGKRAHVKTESKPSVPAAPVARPAPKRAPLPKKPQTGILFTALKDTAWHGRPKLSDKEIAAVMSGGAE